jgi:epoxyqueuosine reductase
MNEKHNITELIREKAFETGFDLFGIAQSEPLHGHKEIIERWCAAGMNGEMSYLGRNIEKRINPGLVLQGAKSVIVAGLNYYSVRKQGGGGVPVLSRYAYGADYHDVIMGKLNGIIDFMKMISPEVNAKAYVDSAPVLEKAWARKAGLGWPGRHSILINEHIGSFFFIGVIITSLSLEYDNEHTKDYCGSCRICIDSCPLGAINDNRTIDTRKCIACLTIEGNEPVDKNIVESLDGRIFGCDICQEVCPWNKKAKQHNTPEFNPSSELIGMTRDEWRNMSKEKFRLLFKKSPVGRQKFETFIQNVTNVTK